jgi:uncharacterized protein (TIGR02145 family)
LSAETKYYVSVSSDDVCENAANTRKEVTVTVNPYATAADITATGNTICSGETATLNASSTTVAGGTFRWYTSQTQAYNSYIYQGANFTTPQLTGTTSYFVSVQGDNYCENVFSTRKEVTVTVKEIATAADITANGTTICVDETAALTASATGVTDPVFRWYTSQTQAYNLYVYQGATFTTPQLTGTTSYFVSVQGDDYCENVFSTRKEVTVTVNPYATAGDITANDVTACSGETVTLSASSTTVTGGTFSWYASQTETTKLYEGNTYNVGAVTATITYYVSVFSDDFCENQTGARKPVTVTVKPVALPANVNANDVTVCYNEAATLTATSGLLNPVIRWYASQTAAMPLYQGANYTTGALTATTTFYVTVHNNNICEVTPGNRKPVIATVEICKLIDCDKMLDKLAEEDGYREFKYTHTGTAWDAIPMPKATIESVCYYINDEEYSCGTLATASLDGAVFPIGVSTVKVYAYYLITVDSCEFTVTVERFCPATIPDEEGNIYKATKLGGLCWTENLKTTLIPGTTDPIPFAKPYTCSICPDGLEEIFGLLYTWYSAMNDGSNRGFTQGICPEFWHIPSMDEWNLLSGYDAKTLRSTDYWLDPPGPGTDDYGFDARPAGWYSSAIDRCVDLYGFTSWWSTADSNDNATSAWMSYYCNGIQTEVKKKGDGLSVRCVMD